MSKRVLNFGVTTKLSLEMDYDSFPESDDEMRAAAQMALFQAERVFTAHLLDSMRLYICADAKVEVCGGDFGVTIEK